MFVNKYSFIRWFFFGIALIALLGITYVNIHYVNQVRESNSDKIVEKKRELVRNFTGQVRDKFIQVPRDIWKVNIETIKNSVDKTGLPPLELNDVLMNVATDSLYAGIYFSSSDKTPCESNNGMYEFDIVSKKFIWKTTFPDMVCDGMSIARTRMKVLLSDYSWNTKTTFDTHRSMNIAIIYPPEKRILGYLVVLINTDYLLDTYLTEKMHSFFSEESQDFSIWIHDWVRNRVLISNQSGIEFDREQVQVSEKFPGLFDNWNIHGMINRPISQSLIETQTTKNLIILILSVALLLTSLGFIVYSAQKEQELTNLQSEFLSNVTHELKTPLAVIQAAGENIKDGRVKNEERLHYYGKHIYDEAIRLKVMIEKLLDVARFDSKQIKANPKRVVVDDIVEYIIDRELPFIQNQGFELKLDLNLSDVKIQVDPEQLETILDNLIENAVKYSPNHKFISVKTFLNNSKACISVKDEGVGIPKESITHIFDKFYRIENTLTAHTKGHGLGLSIVKHLIQLNKANISVTSEPQHGTIFTLEFPIWEEVKSSNKRTKNEDIKQHVEYSTKSIV